VTETELAIVLAAIVVGATVKAITGMGLPIIAVPVASLFVDVADAVVVIAFPNMLANLQLALRERAHRREARDLPTMLVANIAGGVIGALALVWLSETLLLILLASVSALYVVSSLTSFEFELAPATTARWSPVVGFIGGCFQGAIGISGPIIGSWVHSLRLRREAFVFSITSIFFVSGLAQFSVFVAQGELSGRWAATLLACIPVLAAGPIGARIRGKLSTETFDRAVLALISVSIVSIVFKLIS
jgi:uncharacterized membrane protein YfcA